MVTYLVRLDHVDEGERVHAGEASVDADVEQDPLLLELEQVARAAHLRRKEEKKNNFLFQTVFVRE